MKLNILTNDLDFAYSLYETDIDDAFSIEEPNHIEGAIESWFDIVVILGVTSIPVSLFVNIISSWLLAGFAKLRQRNIENNDIKTELEKNEVSFKLILSNTDSDEIKECEITFKNFGLSDEQCFNRLKKSVEELLWENKQ